MEIEAASGSHSTTQPAKAVTRDEWGDDLEAALLQDLRSVTAVLQQVYDKDSFRSGQLEAIQAILCEGRDVLGVFPPGHGKTVTLQFPAAVFNKKVALIVTPLAILRETQAKGRPKRDC